MMHDDLDIVFCEECEYHRPSTGECTAECWNLAADECPVTPPNGYCHYGKRKEG